MPEEDGKDMRDAGPESGRFISLMKVPLYLYVGDNIALKMKIWARSDLSARK